MKSNVCKIEKGSKDLVAIFNESERVASYNGLNHKQTLQLRLLCEEVDGMLPNIIDDFDGELWFEFKDGECKINVSLQLYEMNVTKKEELINVSKDKKNAAAVGITGKIRSILEDYFLNDETLKAMAYSTEPFRFATGFSDGVDYAYLWSLEQYRNNVGQDRKTEDWDELEKSVIASVADDVIVGVKGKRADIVIVKKFN